MRKVFIVLIMFTVLCCDKDDKRSIQDKELISGFLDYMDTENENVMKEMENFRKEVNSGIESEQVLLGRGQRKIINLYNNDSIVKYLTDKNHIRDKATLYKIKYSMLRHTQYRNEFESKGYKIIHYNQVNTSEILQSSEMYSNIVYEKKEDLYYVIYDNDIEQIAVVIIENNKIISFFPEVLDNSSDEGNNYIPYMLTQFD